MKLKFLGTGGGRYVTGEQRRQTGGIVIKTEETQLHLDPGPGALVYTHKMVESPEKTEAVIVSHAHPDHSNDAEPIIEMMTETYDHPGKIYGNETTLSGYSDIEKVISSYHKDLCRDVKILGEGDKYEFKDVEIESQQMFHGDPRTQGIILEDEEQKIGFWTDTMFSDELVGFYSDCDTIVAYCARPRNKGVKGHTSLDDIPKILNELEAKTVIITHFGWSFLDSDMKKEKEWLEEQISQKVIFAEDGMEFPGNRKLGDF